MESSSPPLLQCALERITFTVVDVETSGLDPVWGHRLCEIAIVLQQGGRELETFTQRVNPERPIDPGAQAVHGISYEELQDAPRFMEIAPIVRAYLECAVVVGHNVLFDAGFLAAEWRRLRWPPPCVHLVDTLMLARRWLGLASNRLTSVAEALGIPINAAHSALGDARITAQVLHALLRILSTYGVVTLSDLIDAQGGPITWPRSHWDQLPDLLQEALVFRRRIWLRYVSEAGIVTERWVEPLDANTEYLIAYCHLRQAQRLFRLDRILAMWF
ncbi:MAG: exonuclease domain-containing protein [Anaerolineae bacterium]